ncbi:MAG: efflux RND transporter periplasmic adaptor subunit [Mesorhizobium sp.]|nr:MAG: efflux RND transporter periplasmic adaptor subunit [Mesorhizobium sp.]
MPTKEPSRPQPPTLRVVPEAVPAPSLKEILGDAAPRKQGMSSRIWRWLITAAAVLAVGLLAWLYLGQGNAYTYTTQKATKGDLTVIVTATGSMQPITEVDVSSEISGIIRRVNVDYNSIVHRGEVLAELDTDALKASLANARAKLAVAEANAAKAKVAANAAVTTYERQSALFNRGVMSTQALEDTRLTMDANAAALQAAEAEVLVAEADLQMAETNLARATIASPIDGIVLTRSIDEGSTVAASLQAPVLFSIAGDLKQMEVQVDVDEADIGSVAVGQSASFTVDAYPNRSFPAEITDIRVVSETVNDVVTYKALLKVDNAELLLRPGMTATADIVVKTVKSALLVPNTALRYSPPEESSGSGILGLFRPPRMKAVTTAELPGGGRTLWVMRDKVPTEVTVQVGATDGQNTELMSGDIAEGDDLVVDAVAAE